MFKLVEKEAGLGRSPKTRLLSGIRLVEIES